MTVIAELLQGHPEVALFAALSLGFFLGKVADHWLHTKWIYLAGLLFGAVVGFWQMIRMALRAGKER